MSIILSNADVVTPFHVRKNCSITIENGRIAGMDKKPSGKTAKKIDLTGKIVIPGLIDLHIHGAGGYDFARFDPGEMETLSSTLLSHGVTGILITLYPEPKKDLIKNIRHIVEAVSKINRRNIICGIHLEGPFLNRKMRGSLNPDNFLKPDMDDWYSIYESCRGHLKLMTIAPELPGSMDIIRDASFKGVVISMGHTEASYEDISIAIDNGAAQVTHIYNAMPPLHHRDPGILGACYLSNELKVQLIADCVHVHPATIQFLLKVKGEQGILLVSDAIPAAGKPEGSYEFAGKKINIKGGKAFLDDGTIAGSCLTMDLAIKNMIELAEIPIASAVRMGTLNPARVLRKDVNKGIIAVGKDADLVVLNRNYEVEMTMLQGEVVYNKNDAKN